MQVLRILAFKSDRFKNSEIKNLKVIDEAECNNLREVWVDRNAGYTVKKHLPIPVELSFASFPLKLMLTDHEEFIALEIEFHHLVLHELGQVSLTEVASEYLLSHLKKPVRIASEAFQPHTQRSVFFPLHQL